MASGAVVAVALMNRNKSKTEVTESDEQFNSRSHRVLNLGISEAFTKEMQAATLIARAWRRRFRGNQLDRKRLVERLLIEDAVCVGITRLTLFVAMFLVLYSATTIGSSPAERRAVEIVLSESLDLDAFTESVSLPQFREQLKRLSSATKAFSASGSDRFPDKESVQILGPAKSFTIAKSLPGLQVEVASEEFTLAAWVESTDDSHHLKPVIRKPMITDASLNCWGWYFPGAFRFGAQDYHSVIMDLETTWQEEVASDAGYPSHTLSHEAIVVHNHTVFFYRMGTLLNEGGTVLPRAITDCENLIEVGHAGLKLSQLKFYPRALSSAELSEEVVAGQPLSEIATGSIIAQYEDDAHERIATKVAAQAAHTEVLLEAVDEKRVVDDIVADAEAAESEALREAALFSDDAAPAAALHPLDSAGMLAEHERHAWEAAQGQRLNLSDAIEDQWRSEGEEGSYWSVFERPIYSRPTLDSELDIRERNEDSDPLVAMNLSGVPHDAEVLTFTFWVKAVQPREKFTTFFRIGGLDEYDVLGYHLLSYGGAALRVTDAHSTWAQLTQESLAAMQEEGPLDEKFFITAFNHDPIPTVWRHIAVQFHLKHGYHKSFVDGRLMATTHWHTDHGVPWDIDVRLLEGKNLSIGSAPWYDTGRIKSKVAQFRMYPRELTQTQIQHIQDSAAWPDGSPIKQCLEVTDNRLQDTDGVDHHGRSCSWYHKVMEHTGSNLVCTSAAAKSLCPLTCRGARECASGFPFDGHVHDAHHEELAARAHTHFRIFDRVMHLRPRSDDLPTVVCPAASVDAAALLAECEAQNATYDALPYFYEGFGESLEDTWEGHGRVDARDCAALAQRVDDRQCQWDDSWVSSFQSDLEETQAFSVSWWAHSAAGSRGMPERFSPAFLFFGDVVPPRTLFDVREQNPFQEAVTRLAVPTQGEGQVWSDVRHRGSVDFVNEWIFYYVSYSRLDSGEWMQCFAINGFPQQCHHSPHYLPLPHRFLSAFEVTTEMLITPIEFSTEVLSTPELQEKYYRNAAKMETLTGPRLSELERLAAAEAPPEKEVRSFAQQVLLAAPPFLYQTRSEEQACESEVMQLFLAKQLALIKGTHCIADGTCPSINDPVDVYACKGRGASSGSYYGVELSPLSGVDVYADFLYSLADNAVVVREGADQQEQVLPAVEFVDRATDRANVLCLFHTPLSGQTTVLDIVMTANGARVDVAVDFTHLSFLDADARAECVRWWTCFFLLSVATVALNLVLFANLYSEAKDFPDVGWDGTGVFECVYDGGQVAVLVAYGTAKLSAQLNSEADAQTLVSDFVDVPFRDSNETVKSKVEAFFRAVDTMRALLASEYNLQVLGFVIMVLMLIRIINATAVHPRTGVLIGTIQHGLKDVWHFAILFLLVFVFSSMVASWSFSTRPAFQSLSASMQTQFDMVLGSLPDGYAEDPLLIIYVALTNIVQFFLMLNFLLAIVVESYMGVRKKIQELETENEITYDLCLTLYYGAVALRNGWPNRRRLATLLKHRNAKRTVSWIELHVLGMPRTLAAHVLDSYFAMEVLHPQRWEREVGLDQVGERAEEAAVQAQATAGRVRALEAASEQHFQQLHARLDALMSHLGCPPAPPPPEEAAPDLSHVLSSTDARDQAQAGAWGDAVGQRGAGRLQGGSGAALTETEDVEDLRDALNTTA